MHAHNLDSPSLSLNTDLYELTMAYGYWKLGMMDHEACFHLFFRRQPFHGSFAVAAGLETAIEFINAFHFDESDIAYLKTMKSRDGSPLFEEGFLQYLSELKLNIDVDAMPEGTPVFPQEPFLRIKGPILHAQLLESALLNIINFQTLIATKASRIVRAAEGDEVVEFGLRRAQGIDGALSGARAAYVGGCHSTSNTLAGKAFGIPVRGTHAHSWIQAFGTEKEAFTAYAQCMPNNCIFLVDTYNTLDGVRNAVEVGKKMREEGSEMVGVRIDSGDLAHLSIEVRKILDEGGFPDAKIMASNELDEFIIRDLKQQGAKVNIWGVGTNLITGKEQPALDGVYKLTAIKPPDGEWEYKVKISEQPLKTTIPGILQVRRYTDQFGYCQDVIYDERLSDGVSEALEITDPTKQCKVNGEGKDLLMPIFRDGKQVYTPPSLDEVRAAGLAHMKKFRSSFLRFLNPQFYSIGIEKTLYEKKNELMRRGG